VLRADGRMGIYAHTDGDPAGKALTPDIPGPPLQQGQSVRLTLEVSPTHIRWSRAGGPSVQAQDSRFRGGYLHAGRSGGDGRLNLRHLTIRS